MSANVLRFVTAGSVDDGKSTLIGRLLFDSKVILADQLESISKAKHKRSIGDAYDLSLLTDGLEAEREQGITIDIAYRYFATPKRKFIIADAPGHEEYTRNMITGSSTADAIIILIDAAKVHDSILNGDGLLIQTKRHSNIAQLLKIKHIIVAVNKMDLVKFDKNVYDNIISTYQKFAGQLGLTDITPIPLSALLGDNVVEKSNNMPWYQGPSLIQLLESLNVYDDSEALPFRFPVQWVLRHNGDKTDGFRGYMGRIESGKIRIGDTLIVQPSGRSASVKEIMNFNVSLDSASAGQSITLVLNEHLDISRGAMISNVESPATILNTIEADICWLSEDPLDLRNRYWLKHTTKQTLARVVEVKSLLDISNQQRSCGAAAGVKMNDIVRVTISLQDAIAADSYDSNRGTGAFILIDEVTHQTAAAGMIRFN